MRRRAVIKSIGFLGLLGISSGTYIGFRWNLFKNVPDINNLDSKRKTIEALVNLILPKTNTPGAAECNVQDFVLLMIRECTDKRSQINFTEGIKDLQDYAHSETGRSFEQCDYNDKVSILQHFEQKGKPLPGILGKAKHKFLGKSFFTLLKNYTSIGYFTSMKGATESLNYLAIPTKYIACVNVSDYPKSWATE